MKLLRINDVRLVTGLSPASIYKGMAAGEFPRSVAISARARGWLDSDIDAWIEGRVAASRLDSVGGR